MAKIDYNFLIKGVTDSLNKNYSFYNEMGENMLMNTLRIYFDKEAEKELKKLHKIRVSDKKLELDTMSDYEFYNYAQDTVMGILMDKAIALGLSSIKEERNDLQ